MYLNLSRLRESTEIASVLLDNATQTVYLAIWSVQVEQGFPLNSGCPELPFLEQKD